MSEDEGKETKAPGPEPERVKADDGWKDAVKKALKKKKPPEGWPREDEKVQGVAGDATETE